MAGCECCDNFSMIDGGDEFKAFPGLKGEDGTTFYPHVSADGIISWTNDGGKPNPDPVSIKGTDGKSAYQAAVEAGFSGTEAEFNEYLSNIGVLTEEVAQQKSAIEDLQDLTNRKAGALIDTASGSIASFVPDSTIDNLLGVTVAVEPVQAGSGDPSPDNVRPISGWDEVGIQSRGVNLSSMQSATSNSGGALNYSHNGKIATLKGGFSYTLSFDVLVQTTSGASEGDRLGVYINNTTAVMRVDLLATGRQSASFTAQEDCYINFWSGSIWPANTKVVDNIQLEIGSTATDYHPYSGSTYTITLGQTVYGGTLDAVNGTLTIDRAAYTWSSGGTLTTTKAYQLVRADVVKIDVSNQTTLIGTICDKLPSGTWAQIANDSASMAGCVYGHGLAFRIAGYTTAAEYDAFLAENPLQFVYLLDSPVTIQLDPVTISTISGQTNNVWADAGVVTVEFAADLKHYIDRKIAAAVAALS